MCCHLQKNRPNSQKDRRLIKTGRQAGQTFGVRDVGHRGEKIMLHSTFTADWREASSPFSDSICCSETRDSSGFSSHHTPFLPYHSLNLFYLWVGSVGDLPYLPLSTWTTSRWAEQGSSPCRQLLLCPLLPTLWDWKEPKLLPPLGLDHGNPPPAHVTHTDAWLKLHRLKCHWTLMYSPLPNTWLLIQSPLVWSTGFNFGSWLRPCYLGFTPREAKHPGLLIRYLPSEQDWACTNKIVPELAALTAKPEQTHTHFLGILFPIPLFWSSSSTMFVKV